MKVTPNDLRVAELHHPCCHDQGVLVGVGTEWDSGAARPVWFDPGLHCAQPLLYLLWGNADDLWLVGEHRMRRSLATKTAGDVLTRGLLQVVEKTTGCSAARATAR